MFKVCDSRIEKEEEEKEKKKYSNGYFFLSSFLSFV